MSGSTSITSLRDGVQILDATLRDGSYVNDFNFTAAQTKTICRALEAAGIDLIEVGHGAGIGAGRSRAFESAAESDEDYMIAAAEACNEANWGMFCFPGLGSPDGIRLAANHGADFVRVGCHVTEVESAKEYINAAQEAGIFVSANMVKTNAVSPSKFATQAQTAEEYGVDMVSIVDSAGGLVPEDVREYVREAKSHCDLPIGFHGHDNLGVATANCVAAVRAGAAVVDTSLQGYGRSGGNAPTETTVAALKKTGFDVSADVPELLRVGHKHVGPLRDDGGWNPLDIAGGYADVHSEHIPVILEYAREYDVDPTLLMCEVSKHDKVYAPRDLVEELAESLNDEEGGSVDDYQ